MATSFIGFGTIFSRENNTPGTYDDLAGILEIGELNKTRNVVDNIFYDSSSGYIGKLAGLRNAGEISVTLVYDVTEADSVLLEGDLDIAALHNYRITWGDASGTTATFAGLVTSVGIATPIEDKVTQAFTIAISGEPTFA